MFYELNKSNDITNVDIHYNHNIQIDSLMMNPKVKIIYTIQRQTYKMMTDYANEYLQNEIVCIANTDIWFDDSLKKLNYMNLEDTMLTITRMNQYQNYDIENLTVWCHDVWIYRTPLKQMDANLTMGILGCDTLFNIRLKKPDINYQILLMIFMFSMNILLIIWNMNREIISLTMVSLM